jgi:hypothetical protein
MRLEVPPGFVQVCIMVLKLNNQHFSLISNTSFPYENAISSSLLCSPKKSLNVAPSSLSHCHKAALMSDTDEYLCFLTNGHDVTFDLIAKGSGGSSKGHIHIYIWASCEEHEAAARLPTFIISLIQ